MQFLEPTGNLFSFQFSLGEEKGMRLLGRIPLLCVGFRFLEQKSLRTNSALH